MAEFVEQNIQEMIPELEDLERIGFLSPVEIKKLIEKRKDFEYRIAKTQKNKQDFINYVMFDCKLLDLLHIRRQKLGSTESKTTEKSIIVRVLRRLRLMSRRWPSQMEIWDMRIAFCKSRKFIDEVSTAFAEWIRYHGNNEAVWVRWAQWEMEGRNNFERAREILLYKAPMYHPKSLTITKECFRLELLYIEYIKKKQTITNNEGLEEIIFQNRQKVLECGVAELLYKNALTKFETPDIYFQFYSVAEKFEFACNLREKIFTDLLAKYPNDKIAWELRAKRMLKGLQDPSEEPVKTPETGVEERMLKDSHETGVEEKILKDLEDSPEEPVKRDAMDIEKMNASFIEQQEINCSTDKENCSDDNKGESKVKNICCLYDKALVAVGSQFLTSYIEELFELLHQCWGYKLCFKFITEKLLLIFSNNALQLSAVHTLFWFNLALHLKKSNEELEEIITQASSLHPDCPQIQLELLKISLSTKKCTYDPKTFVKDLHGEIGIQSVMALINHSQKRSFKNILFSKACNHTDKVLSREMRLKHIQYLSTVEGFRGALSKYEEYSSLPPFSVELHTTIIKLALQEKKVLLSAVRKVFDTAIQQFSSHAGLWLSYIGFENKFGGATRVPMISTEAEKQLQGEEFQKFLNLKLVIGSQTYQESMENINAGVRETKEDMNYEFWPKSCLGPVIERPKITRKAKIAKKRFFVALNVIWKEMNGKTPVSNIVGEKDELRCWEELLSKIQGENVSLRLKEVNMALVDIGQNVQKFVEDSETLFKKRMGVNISLSETLQQTSLSSRAQTSIMDDEIKKILATSEVLQPDFLKKKQILPFRRNKIVEKNIRKKQEEQTAGKGWFNMKAPKLTEEVKRDLEILKLRSVLDPHRHYKRNDMKTTPKYFQMGKVVDSPLDFYSSRIVKKHRKNTMAEEIINDETVLSYQKRKFAEIMEKKNAKKRKIQKEMRKTKGKKRSSKKI